MVLLPVITQGLTPLRRRSGATAIDDTFPPLRSNPVSADSNEEGGPSDG
jgi:hypothetical protein